MGSEILTGDLGLSQSESWNQLIHDKYFIFQSAGGTFVDDRLSIFNMEDRTLKTIYDRDDLSKLYIFGDNLFFFGAAQSHSVHEGLYYYSFENEELEEIYDFEFGNRDLHPVGVQDGYLYFFGNLDEDANTGTAIYRIALDIASNTYELNTTVKELKFIQIANNSFVVETERDGQFDMEIYNLGGQLIKRQSISNGSIIEIPFSGVAVLKTNLKNAVETHLKVVAK
ncbi:MAG: hypothetical protein AAFO07_18380 [Bacteroidota bacterium]